MACYARFRGGVAVGIPRWHTRSEPDIQTSERAAEAQPEDGARGEQNELAGSLVEGIGDPLRKGWCLRNDHPALTGDIRTAALSPVLVSLLGCREHGDVQALHRSRP
jgi:hypothetical protein